MNINPNGERVRVRFAPSPTGELHLGGARTALYNYLFAKKLGGTVILRVEDTDQKRFVAGSMDRFMDDLAWLGVHFDESPGVGGPYGPYIQSERAERHREVAHQLVAKGAAYYEFNSQAGGGSKDDEEYRAGRTVYRSSERDSDPVRAKERVDAGEPFVVRLKVPASGVIAFDDAVRGRVEFDLMTIDDAVLLKSDGMATYHLAAMTDDHDMEISHIFRTEEWLPSTPKHLLVFKAMNWETPKIAHLPLLLAADGKKLSKRLHGEAVWMRTYRDRGYLPEAMANYLALLGWNPGGDQELLSSNELIDLFSLERVHKAGAKFDEEKLNAFQQYYVRELSDDELIRRVNEFVLESGRKIADQQNFDRAIVILKDRITTLDEVCDLAEHLRTDQELIYEPALLIFRKSHKEQTTKGLTAAYEQLAAGGDETWESEELLSQLLDRVVTAGSFSNGDVFWPVRVALTGQERSPSPAECLWVLGKQDSLLRLSAALEKLQ